mmetsp:Transcript_55658/g.130286  ORF Transcript_55658/g.130286 Transcript_55658/m.130286 type:complete len:206 (-) Transcript_55658:204-821(-)
MSGKDTARCKLRLPCWQQPQGRITIIPISKASGLKRCVERLAAAGWRLQWLWLWRWLWSSTVILRVALAALPILNSLLAWTRCDAALFILKPLLAWQWHRKQTLLECTAGVSSQGSWILYRSPAHVSGNCFGVKLCMPSLDDLNDILAKHDLALGESWRQELRDGQRRLVCAMLTNSTINTFQKPQISLRPQLQSLIGQKPCYSR